MVSGIPFAILQEKQERLWVMAYQEIEEGGEGGGLERERRLSGAWTRVSTPREGGNDMLGPLLRDWSLGHPKSRGGPAQNVPDSPYAHPGKSLVENPL